MLPARQHQLYGFPKIFTPLTADRYRDFRPTGGHFFHGEQIDKAPKIVTSPLLWISDPGIRSGKIHSPDVFHICVGVCLLISEERRLFAIMYFPAE